MNKCFFMALSLALFSLNVSAQCYTESQQQAWLQKAEASKPVLNKTTHHPVREVKIVADANAFQGFKAVEDGDINDLYSKSFKKKKEVIVDFGKHLVGNVSFKIKDIGPMQDAVLRFKVTFGEIPSDLGLPVEPYTGSLSRGWMQDFQCDVSYDGCYTFNRRITARYMKIEAVGTSIYSDFCFDNITFEATTSAGKSKAQLASTTPQIFKDIARVSENTLKDCMQGVFEDGPKRDQRLWMGDLYLEALANTASFKEYNVTKRCLYLLAGLANPDNGLLYSNMVEYPKPHAQQTFFVDYALSYILTLNDYLKATGDTETARDLWPVVKNQINTILAKAIDNNHLYANTGYQYKGMMVSIVFFDWAPVTLDNHAAIQGLLAHSIDCAYNIAKVIGKTNDVKAYPATAKQLRKAGYKAYWDAKKQIVVSGKERQESYTATSWAVLGDLIKGNEAQKAIRNVMQSNTAIKPGTPYANHFLVAAMLHCGMNSEAKKYVEDYWGGMVRLGADTFWEYYVPDNHLFSSYNGYTLLNSYCHAWSCTPIYFIVNYPEIFQK
ncbi:alpha-L-rhamnosidase-related protein [Prevotella sp.]|uniref:alpha-L-rhamnosidase-related protein n=1 Tax=Prevotella sp. TaxID=59823 RepID=UPI0027E25866|nr:glycoside hydrolase [Prevotella sp.]